MGTAPQAQGAPQAEGRHWGRALAFILLPSSQGFHHNKEHSREDPAPEQTLCTGQSSTVGKPQDNTTQAAVPAGCAAQVSLGMVLGTCQGRVTQAAAGGGSKSNFQKSELSFPS